MYKRQWYNKAIESSTVQELLWTSLSVATIVMFISMFVGFFGALAFARYEWRFRNLFQKVILLPIFFPQAVLGLALLMWFNSVGIIPSWKTAVIAHLVWISPIATLIIAIRAYSFDPSLEEAARDMGASTWTILKEITGPLLMPGVVSAGLFAFLLSWGNFPLSLFTTGADSTLPEWLYAKMVSDANGGAHKIYNAITHAMLCKKAKKKYMCTDTGAGYNGKMFSMVAKKFGLGCKIFMGTRDIERQKPNCDAIRKNGAEIVPVTSGSKTLVDAVSECIRYWVSNCDKVHMGIGSLVGPNIFVKICGWSTAQISRELKVQLEEEFGEIPNKLKLINCVGGGSSAYGFWSEFFDYNKTHVELIGVELSLIQI